MKLMIDVIDGTCHETVDWKAGLQSHDGHAWTFSGYGHVNSSLTHH